MVFTEINQLLYYYYYYSVAVLKADEKTKQKACNSSTRRHPRPPLRSQQLHIHASNTARRRNIPAGYIVQVVLGTGVIAFRYVLLL